MTTTTEVLAPEIATATREDHATKQAWLQARTFGLGGSDAPVILGKSPYKSPLALYAEKLGLTEPPDVRNDAADWGVMLETPVAEHYATQSGKPLYYPGPFTIYRSTRTPYLAASFDRLILDDPLVPHVVGVLQVKTTGAWHADEWLEEPPLHVLIQVHHEMLVAGVHEAAIAVLIGGQKYLSFEVGLNEDLAELLLQEEACFWQRLVNRDPPEPDGTKSCREILTKLYPKHVEGKTIALPADAIEWDRQLQEANANLEKWKAEKELAENKIKAALGYAERGVLAGGVAYTWKASPRKGYVVQDAIVRTLRRSVAKN